MVKTKFIIPQIDQHHVRPSIFELCILIRIFASPFADCSRIFFKGINCQNHLLVTLRNLKFYFDVLLYCLEIDAILCLYLTGTLVGCWMLEMSHFLMTIRTLLSTC